MSAPPVPSALAFPSFYTNGALLQLTSPVGMSNIKNLTWTPANLYGEWTTIAVSFSADLDAGVCSVATSLPRPRVRGVPFGDAGEASGEVFASSDGSSTIIGSAAAVVGDSTISLSLTAPGARAGAHVTAWLRYY